MCGIVGVIGKSDAAPVILESLRPLGEDRSHGRAGEEDDRSKSHEATSLRARSGFDRRELMGARA